MNENDRKILARISSGSGKTPEKIAAETGMTPNYVRSRLDILAMQGKVRKGDRFWNRNIWYKIG